MKRHRKFGVLCLLNAAILGTVFFFRGGGPFVLKAFPFIHILILFLNLFLAKTRKEYVMAKLIHLISSALAILLIGALYFRFVSVTYDELGRWVMVYMTIGDIIMNLILLWLSCVVVKRRKSE